MISLTFQELLILSMVIVIIIIIIVDISIIMKNIVIISITIVVTNVDNSRRKFRSQTSDQKEKVSEDRRWRCAKR